MQLRFFPHLQEVPLHEPLRAVQLAGIPYHGEIEIKHIGGQAVQMQPGVTARLGEFPQEPPDPPGLQQPGEIKGVIPLIPQHQLVAALSVEYHLIALGAHLLQKCLDSQQRQSAQALRMPDHVFKLALDVRGGRQDLVARAAAGPVHQICKVPFITGGISRIAGGKGVQLGRVGHLPAQFRDHTGGIQPAGEQGGHRRIAAQPPAACPGELLGHLLLPLGLDIAVIVADMQRPVRGDRHGNDAVPFRGHLHHQLVPRGERPHSLDERFIVVVAQAVHQIRRQVRPVEGPPDGGVLTELF